MQQRCASRPAAGALQAVRILRCYTVYDGLRRFLLRSPDAATCGRTLCGTESHEHCGYAGRGVHSLFSRWGDVFPLLSTMSSCERRVVPFKILGSGRKNNINRRVRRVFPIGSGTFMRPCAPEQLESLYSGPHEAAGRVGSRSISDSQRGRVACLNYLRA